MIRLKSNFRFQMPVIRTDSVRVGLKMIRHLVQELEAARKLLEVLRFDKKN